MLIDGDPGTDSEKEFPLIACGGVNVVVVVPVALQLPPVVDQLSVNVEMAFPVTVNVNDFPCEVVPLQLPSNDAPDCEIGTVWPATVMELLRALPPFAATL
jgi:hypothetical protein